MFSQTVRLSASMKCWCTMPIPTAIASAGEWKATCLPLTAMVPSSGWCMPYSVFISVDLPAPFSPTSACTVPRRTVMLMSEFATTPGNRLVIPVSCDGDRPRPAPRPACGRREIRVSCHRPAFHVGCSASRIDEPLREAPVLAIMQS